MGIIGSSLKYFIGGEVFISSPEDIEVTLGGRCDSKGNSSTIEEISSCSSIGCGCCGDDGGSTGADRNQ